MRALLVDAPRSEPRLSDLPEPDLPPHAARVRVRAAGLCRSDWHAWAGHDDTVSWPHVPGHEFAGEVVEVGSDVRGVRLGQRVTAPFCCGCGSCATCREGATNLCEREYQPGFDAFGAFAETVVVPWAEVNLAELPDDLDYDAAAALGCRFMTSYGALVRRAQVRPGSTVVVIGCGGLGLSAVLIAAAAGARVIAVDVRQEPLDLAVSLVEGRGDLLTIRGDRVDPVAAVRDATAGGADLSVDALGSPGTCGQAIRSLRRRGTHLQLGLLLAEHASPPVPIFEVVRRELRIQGGHGMPAHAYPELFRFLRAGQVPVRRLVGHRAPLAEGVHLLPGMDREPPTGVTILTP